MNKLYLHAAAFVGAAFMAGCAATFQPAPIADAPFIDRAITQSENGISVTATVLSADEFAQIAGMDVYADGIQPLWLSIENERARPVRVAYASIDADYYSPLEVAWYYRKDFRKRSRADLDRWFHETKLPRGIPAGDGRSGFVYTHVTGGTKGFNVDVYDEADSAQFTFFVPLPGFRPDYMDVEFQSLYEDGEIRRTDREGLRDLIRELPCCTTDEAGRIDGDPLNLVLVGSANTLRRALLRGEWHETESGSVVTAAARAHRFRDRQPDGIFFRERPDGTERKELRLWLAPILVDDAPVWIGAVNYDMSGNAADPDEPDFQLDPDIDDARMYAVQNFWYSQSLAGVALEYGLEPVPIEAPRTNFQGQSYFTDGKRAVLFLSGDPIGMDETEIIFWEAFVGR